MMEKAYLPLKPINFSRYLVFSPDILVMSETYLEFFWADQLHLGVPPPPFHNHVWRKFLNLVPPDALKMHSLPVPVLRFHFKTFSKLRNLNNETLLRGCLKKIVK